jgi:predicted DNA-binding antitoxin AbrB/MazE fold protein
MVQSIRVIYEDGILRPLEPVLLKNGQTVLVTIDPDQEISVDELDARLRRAGVLLESEAPDDLEELTIEERERIGRLFLGKQPSEDLIDEERGLY